jgi:hypothetical protein
MTSFLRKSDCEQRSFYHFLISISSLDFAQAERAAFQSLQSEIQSAIRWQTSETLQTDFPLELKKISDFVLEDPGSRFCRFGLCRVMIFGAVLAVSTGFLSKFLDVSNRSVRPYLSSLQLRWIRTQLSKQERDLFASFLRCPENEWMNKVTFWREIIREEQGVEIEV